MWFCKSRFPLWFSVFLIAGLMGCNYTFSTNSPTPLPPDIRSIYLEKVENPTNLSWLEFELRSKLRDEMNKHGRVFFADRESAQSLMRVEIESSSIGTKLENEHAETVRSQAKLVLQARIFRKKDHKLLWESGGINIRESFPGKESEENDSQVRSAREKAVEYGVEELVNRLRHGF